MAMKKGDGWWIVGLLIAGLGLLYYAQTGLGKERDSALIPNILEGRIDALIAALNNKFGKRWVDFGVVAVKYELQRTLPASLVALVDIVANVENTSKVISMSSYEKKRLAVQMARGS